MKIHQDPDYKEAFRSGIAIGVMIVSAIWISIPFLSEFMDVLR